MKVELAKLKPNSLRSFEVDPIEEEAVQTLAGSIKDYKWWGGVVGRQTQSGDIEIIAGSTRVAGAIAARLTHAEIVVGRYSDEEAVRIYAMENMSQRGPMLSSAVAGAVLAGVRVILKGVLTGDERMSAIADIPEVLGNVASDKGIGAPILAKFFKDVPHMTEGVINSQLSNLKSSGDYARVVELVKEELASEQAAEREELTRREAEATEAERKLKEAEAEAVEAQKRADKRIAREAEAKRKAAEKAAIHAQAKVDQKTDVKQTRDAAEKAASAAKKRPITFDLAGVSKYLKSEYQVRVFKKIVERENIQKHVPVNAQSKLAALLVKYSQKHAKGQLSGAFIETYLTEIIRNASLHKGGDLDLELSPEVLRSIEHESAQTQFNDLAHNWCRSWGTITLSAAEMIRLKDQYPDLEFRISQELRNTVKFGKTALDKFASRLNI